MFFNQVGASIKQWLPLPSKESVARQGFFEQRQEGRLNETIRDRSLFNVNQFIADSLPYCTYKTAELKQQKDGKIVFTFLENPKEKEKIIVIFPDEKTFDQWLAEKSAADIWEIVDLRDQPRLTYKLHRMGADGYDNKTKKELETQLTEDYGVLWKIKNLENQQIRYYQSKEGIFHRYVKEVDHRNLIHITNGLVESRSQEKSICRGHCSRRKGIKAVLLGALAVFAGKNLYEMTNSSSSYANLFQGMQGSLLHSSINAAFVYKTSMENGMRDSAQTHALLAGLSSFFPLGESANTPPVVTNPIGLIEVFPEEPLVIPDVDKMFSDPDGDTLEFSTPFGNSFLSTSITHPTRTFLAESGSSATITGVHFVDQNNIGYRFQIGLPLDIYNLSASENVYKISSFYYNTAALSGLGEVKGNYAYVNNNNVFIIVDINDLLSPTLVNTINKLGGGHELAIDHGRNIIWFHDASFFNATDITNPIAPIFYNGVDVALVTETVAVDGKGFVYVLDETTSRPTLHVIDGTDPANPVLVSSNTLAVGSFADTLVIEDDIAYMGRITEGVQLYNFTNPYSINLMTSYRRSAFFPRSIRLSGPYIFVAFSDGTGSGRGIRLLKNNFVTYADIPLLTGTTSTNDFFVQGNQLFIINTEGDFITRDINVMRLSGIAAPQFRGMNEIPIMADDGHGGTVTQNITIFVKNRNPVVDNPMIDQLAEVGIPFFLSVPADTFSDLDGDIFVLSAPGRPPWLVFSPTNNTFYGIPDAVVIGGVSVNLIADDLSGGNVTDIFIIRIINNMPTGSPSSIPPGSMAIQSVVSSGGDSTAVIVIATLAGVCVCGILIGGSLYLYKIKNSSSNDEEEPRIGSFELSSVEKKNVSSVFGEGNYAWLNFNREEHQILYAKTGMIVQTDEGKIANGNYGEIRICWDVLRECYAVAKVVQGAEKCQESAKEAQKQRDAAGPGVWPIHNTIEDNKMNKLIHIMPLAGNGNLVQVRDRIRHAEQEQQIEQFLCYVAKNVLTGIKTIHDKKMTHCDLKGENIVMNIVGLLGITDFGLSLSNVKGKVPPQKSDRRYRSPQRLQAGADGLFNPFKDDLWAAGILLLEFARGASVAEYFKLNDKMTWEDVIPYFSAQVKQFVEIQDPEEGSIWFVIQNLLSVEEKERLAPDELLKMPCFGNLNEEEKTLLFESIRPRQILKIENENSSETLQFYEHDQTEMFYETV